MALINLALVVETRRAGKTEIKEVAAAVQRQLSRDFGPIWGIDATIDPFLSLEDVPPGYWPIYVRDDFPGMGIVGVHLDKRNQPFALVKFSPTWSITVSHEALEMVADPWGNRLIPGGSPMPGQGLVEYLVEICDPVGGVAHAYTINGLLVSDFYTPNFFDPVASRVRYSFTGRLRRPRAILPGGYVSWREPESQAWWQWDWVNRPEPTFNSLGQLPDGLSLRERIDAQLTMPHLYTGAPPAHPAVLKARERYASSRVASRAQADAVRGRIRELLGDPLPAAAPSPGAATARVPPPASFLRPRG